jgi:hypothetical protein
MTFAPLKCVEYDEGNWQCGKESPKWDGFLILKKLTNHNHILITNHTPFAFQNVISN